MQLCPGGLQMRIRMQMVEYGLWREILGLIFANCGVVCRMEAELA